MKKNSHGNVEVPMDLSIVITVYNEADNIDELYRRLKVVLDKQCLKYEIIFVDDGSKDNTYKKISDICNIDNKVRLIRLNRNFGRAVALAAGFDNSYGKIIVTLDVDLQNDPNDIPKFIEKIENNYDLVCGWRKNRKDPYLRKVLPSLVGNFIISRISDIKLHDFCGGFKAYKNEAAKKISLKLYQGFHRFIPLIGKKLGLSMCEIEIKYYPRLFGYSKYGLLRIFEATIDFFILHLIFFPLWKIRILEFIGIAMALWGIMFYYVYHSFTVLGTTLLIFGISTIFITIKSQYILKSLGNVERFFEK